MSYNQTIYGIWNNIGNVFFLNFLPELIGAAFGAALGAYFGYKYGIKQEREIKKEEDRNIKRMYIESLLMELEKNEEILSDGLSILDVDGIKINYLRRILWTFSYDSGITSGKYSLLTKENQKNITSFYMGCKEMNLSLSQKFRDLTEPQLIGISKGVEIFFNSLNNILPRIKKELRDELSILENAR